MSVSSEHSRLCRLINDSVLPYTESELIFLTKEEEKQLLIALSQIFKEIQLWIREVDRDSNSETAEESFSGAKCGGCSMSNSEEHRCLTWVVAELIGLLRLKSQYIQHLSGNILGVISEFLAASGSDWDIFIQMLCVSLELAIMNILSNSSIPSMVGLEQLNCSSYSSVVLLRCRLKRSNWSVVAGTLRVLRNILKYLKQEHEDQLVEIYLESISSSLSKIPWCQLDKFFDLSIDTNKGSRVDASKLRGISVEEGTIVFLGNFLQFLSSLVEQSNFAEGSSTLQNKHPIVAEIINLIPRLLCWCLGKDEISVNHCMTLYFRHKLLVLMLRLSFQAHLECSVLDAWLQLLHIYFKGSLQQPINQPEFGQYDSLDSSPFSFNVSGGKISSTHSCHLQRLVVLLFLRCSLILITLRGDGEKKCLCTTQNSRLPIDSNWALACCIRNKALLDLYGWFQGHMSTYVLVDHKMHIEKSISFASSFIQLYIHEDDLLFKVLIQLVSVPFCAEQQFCEHKLKAQDSQEDIFVLVASLFNPIHLFHLFLSELHYDHQVLLDYLISKDIGISCAEYLLRSLRAVCDSWCLFVEFSMPEKVIDKSSFKKRKVVLEHSNFQTSLSSIEKQYKGDADNDCWPFGTRGQPFSEAGNCLLSLKTSVENLHKKKLFPYNPEVLLKRLRRFQELCLKR